MTGQLDNAQMINILSSQRVGRLACTDGKQPYIVPVTFTFDGEYIYGQTNKGTKLEMLRKNPAVCFEVAIITDMKNWQSVIVYGSFEELSGEESVKARNLLFGHVFSLMTSSAVHAHGHALTSEIDDSTRTKELMYRIKIKRLTGRYEKQ